MSDQNLIILWGFIPMLLKLLLLKLTQNTIFLKSLPQNSDFLIKTVLHYCSSAINSIVLSINNSGSLYDCVLIRPGRECPESKNYVSLKKNSRAMTNTGMKGRTAHFYLLVIFCALVLLTNNSTAQGNLLITPRRVVFEGNKLSQELTLANTGADTAKYTVSFVQYKMTEDGSFVQIEQPEEGQLFADKYLRFFPRSVTLPPNGSQVIRMQYRKMPDMQNGEYRSHVYFRAVPNEKLLGEEQVTNDTTSIGIKLVPIFGISIPVIIRNGDLQAKVDLTTINLDLKSDTVPNLTITFERTGDKSVYGDLSVLWAPVQGEPVEVGVVRGIAVYTPNKTRKFKMQLHNAPGVNYSKGKLIIKFQAPNDGKAEIYAEKEFLLK